LLMRLSMRLFSWNPRSWKTFTKSWLAASLRIIGCCSIRSKRAFVRIIQHLPRRSRNSVVIAALLKPSGTWESISPDGVLAARSTTYQLQFDLVKNRGIELETDFVFI